MAVRYLYVSRHYRSLMAYKLYRFSFENIVALCRETEKLVLDVGELGIGWDSGIAVKFI